MRQFDANIKGRFIGRHLLSFDEGVEKICKRGSEELNNYYVTRVDETIGLDEEDEDEKDEKTPDYIEALIDLVKGATGESEKEMNDNLMTYGKHLSGVFVALVIAILAIPGWFICCSCCCCNCCCCCCCKKQTCKFPFFIVTLALYVLVAGICLYGLIKSNSIFRGLSDTECSILQFFNETIEGEAKAENPKWAGIEGIKSILTEVKDRINTQGSSTYNALVAGQGQSTNLREQFGLTLHDRSASVTDTSANVETLDGKTYRLDITTKDIYGSFDNAHETGEGYVKNWFDEYKIIADESDRNLQTAATNFHKITDPNPDEGEPVTGYLDEIKDSVDEMGKSVKEVKDSMADSIVEFSDYIDEYGKLGFKIFFSALVVIDAAIAALIFLLCFCSGEKCKNCCLFRCGFKLLIHLFWNILALLMIITLFIGFIFTLIGSIGKDLTFVVNYFISEENMNQAEPALFGAEGKKLFTCFNGEGDILKELSKDGTIDLSKMNSFDNLNDLIEDIKSAERQFNNLKTQCNTYNYMMSEYNRRVNYQGSFSIIQVVTGDDTPLQKDCSLTEVVAVCRELVNKATDNGDTSQSFYYETEAIKSAFDGFLDNQVTTLQTFRNNIKSLTGIFDDYIGENGGIFDFVNCKFIGSNIKVILKNLRKGVGSTFYSVGICLILAGCSLALSISFTILLVVIINSSVDSVKNKAMP